MDKHRSSVGNIHYRRKPKGGIYLPASGYIQVHAITSNAQIPLENVAIAVTATDGTAIALRLTDRSGKIEPIEVPTPPLSESQSPDPGECPYTEVNLHAAREGFAQITVTGLQIFADTTTTQTLTLVPLAEFPGAWDETENFTTLPQNL